LERIQKEKENKTDRTDRTDKSISKKSDNAKKKEIVKNIEENVEIQINSEKGILPNTRRFSLLKYIRDHLNDDHSEELIRLEKEKERRMKMQMEKEKKELEIQEYYQKMKNSNFFSDLNFEVRLENDMFPFLLIKDHVKVFKSLSKTNKITNIPVLCKDLNYKKSSSTLNLKEQKGKTLKMLTNGIKKNNFNITFIPYHIRDNSVFNYKKILSEKGFSKSSQINPKSFDEAIGLNKKNNFNAKNNLDYKGQLQKFVSSIEIKEKRNNYRSSRMVEISKNKENSFLENKEEKIKFVDITNNKIKLLNKKEVNNLKFKIKKSSIRITTNSIDINNENDSLDNKNLTTSSSFGNESISINDIKFNSSDVKIEHEMIFFNFNLNTNMNNKIEDHDKENIIDDKKEVKHILVDENKDVIKRKTIIMKMLEYNELNKEIVHDVDQELPTVKINLNLKDVEKKTVILKKSQLNEINQNLEKENFKKINFNEDNIDRLTDRKEKIEELNKLKGVPKINNFNEINADIRKYKRLTTCILDQSKFKKSSFEINDVKLNKMQTYKNEKNDSNENINEKNKDEDDILKRNSSMNLSNSLNNTIKSDNFKKEYIFKSNFIRRSTINLKDNALFKFGKGNIDNTKNDLKISTKSLFGVNQDNFTRNNNPKSVASVGSESENFSTLKKSSNDYEKSKSNMEIKIENNDSNGNSKQMSHSLSDSKSKSNYKIKKLKQNKEISENAEDQTIENKFNILINNKEYSHNDDGKNNNEMILTKSVKFNLKNDKKTITKDSSYDYSLNEKESKNNLTSKKESSKNNSLIKANSKNSINSNSEGTKSQNTNTNEIKKYFLNDDQNRNKRENLEKIKEKNPYKYILDDSYTTDISDIDKISYHNGIYNEDNKDVYLNKKTRLLLWN
jgi:hypothetical protein